MVNLVKSKYEVAAMRSGGTLLGNILQTLKGEVAPGVTTKHLNEVAEKMILDAGAKPAFKGYSIMNLPPFPCALCTSINDEVVHGTAVPSRTLQEGDIVGLDLGLIYTQDDARVFLDAAITVPVGTVNSEVQQLIDITKQSLMKGIEQVKDGARTGDIGHAVESFIKPYGYGIVKELVGHGVGREIHEPPQIPNYGKAGSGVTLETGMTIAIEPMTSLGSWRVIFEPNSWRVTTEDHALSAHFEHTVLVTEDGYEILTLPE